MPEYLRLKGVPLTAVADTISPNAGNWTASLDVSAVSKIQQIECYQMTVDGPVGFGLSVFINRVKWSHTSQGWKNAWDPNEPMILNPSDMIYLYFEAPSSLTPVPTASLWFRYDLLLPNVPGR